MILREIKVTNTLSPVNGCKLVLLRSWRD